MKADGRNAMIYSLIALLAGLSVVSVFLGAKQIGAGEVVRGGEAARLVMAVSRLPRLASILLTGMALSTAGLIMQQITRNRFVSPTTAATMDSARLGVLFAMLVLPQASSLQKMGTAFGFALVGSFAFMALLGKMRAKNVIIIPLVGIMLGTLIDSVTTFFAYRYEVVQNVNSWLQGSFSLVTRGRYEIIYVTLPLFVLAYLFAHQFTIVGLGEDMARNLGIRYRRVVNLGLVIAALISSAVLVTVGNIPFIGLVVPNIVSLILGDDVKATLPATALSGAVFLLACDLLGRIMIHPYEISISLTSGVIGGAIFLGLLFKGGKAR